ncbi:MAG: CvpA family protein [Gammaproteobacteria bacterium]|nr:CvpA family protein [Gammaproteobacteria bacterium]
MIGLCDGVMCVWIGISAFFGYRRGFAEQALRMLPWWGALFLTFFLMPSFAKYVHTFIPQYDLTYILIAALFSGYGMFYGIGRIIGIWVERVFLGPLMSALLGAALGALEGIIVIAALFACIWFCDLTTLPLFKESYGAKVVFAFCNQWSKKYIWTLLQNQPKQFWRTVFM